jgi:signal peptidase I
MTGAEDGPSRRSAVDPADDATVESSVPGTRSDPDATQQMSAGGIPADPDATRRLPPVDPAAGDAAAVPVSPAPRPRPTWRRIAARFELPILIVVAIAIAVVLKTFVIQPFYIPSQSMEQTLHGCPGCAGDRILVFKPVYHVRDPHPGDIVVFKAPEDWDEPGGQVLSSNPVVHGIQWFGQLIGVVPPSEKDLVKRVIAVGGQTVKCCDDRTGRGAA